jgi:hypothetical protein
VSDETPPSDVTNIKCGVRDAQAGKTCEPFDDPRSHDFQGWIEFDDGCGGTSVCTRCGISAFSHAMRYAP